MYDLLHTTDHPESLTIEEALELSGLASLAFLSENVSTEEIVKFKQNQQQQKEWHVRYLERVVAKAKAVVAPSTPPPIDHCDICKLNREVGIVFGSVNKDILDSIVYNQLKARLENAIAEDNVDSSPRTKGRITFVTSRIRTLLTSSIGEHHAQ